MNTQTTFKTISDMEDLWSKNNVTNKSFNEMLEQSKTNKNIFHTNFPIESYKELDWYPASQCRENGCDNTKSSFYGTFGIIDNTNKQVSMNYINHSIWLVSHREIVKKIFIMMTKVIDEADSPLKIAVTDNSVWIVPDLTETKHQLSVIDPSELATSQLAYDIIVCVGYTHYLDSINDFTTTIKTFHSNMSTNGILFITNLIPPSEQKEDEQVAIKWNLDVVSTVNNKHKYARCMPTVSEISNAIDGLFEMTEYFTGNLRVKNLLVLHKI